MVTQINGEALFSATYTFVDAGKLRIDAQSSQGWQSHIYTVELQGNMLKLIDDKETLAFIRQGGLLEFGP